MMKKIICLVLALTFIFALTGCDKKNMGRVMFNYKLEKFIELKQYEGIEVDTNSEEYKTTYNDLLKADVQNNGFYSNITEGKLQKFDVANINFVGKINGEAFQGGSADNQDLKLGSGQFIPGFEDKLIGVEIGSTVDIDLTFPKDYGSADLAGKNVVFTVKVNHVSSRRYTEGTLKNGYTANIDYTGKLNGVAFEGGTAQGSNLTLGSGQFIPGFEEGLVGAEIGSTVDLNLNFPKDYGSADLAGKAVVFTVKVNYAEGQDAKTPEEYYSELGFKSVEEYYEKTKKNAVSQIILTKIFAESKVIKYPKKEKEMLLNRRMESVEKAAQQYGTTVDTLIQSYMQMTVEEYKDYMMKNNLEPYIQSRMIVYAIFDDAGLKIDDADYKKFIKKEVASFKDAKITEKTLKEQYGEEYFEVLYVEEKVVDYLISKAKIV